MKHLTDPIFNLSIENNFINRNAKKKIYTFAMELTGAVTKKMACCAFPGAAGVCCALKY